MLDALETMTTPLLQTLAHEVTPTPVPAKFQPLGKEVGSFGLYRCWEANEVVRNYFQARLRPEILRRLSGLFGSVSTRDSIIVTLYMIGIRSFTAVPTVLFVSENSKYRKDARKLIKECGILNRDLGWKTAHASKDPAYNGASLEQLASGKEQNEHTHDCDPMTEVLYDLKKPLQPEGMTVYVRHGSSVRTATANLIWLRGQAFYLAPAHTFFGRSTPPASPSNFFIDDFEIDSDDEDRTVRGDDPIEDRIHCFESLDADASSYCSEYEDRDPLFSDVSDDDNYSESSYGSITDLGDTTAHYDATPIAAPRLDSLRRLGVLSRWSIDKDWALISVTSDQNRDIALFLGLTLSDLSTLSLATPKSAHELITAHTTSGGKMTGTLLGTLSDYRLPYATSFQEVYSIRLDGGLADGDCGSVVINAVTGELYGHIIAGCRATGFAYVMAAHHVLPDLNDCLVRTESLSEESEKKIGHQVTPTLSEQLSTGVCLQSPRPKTDIDSIVSNQPRAEDSVETRAMDRGHDRQIIFDNIVRGSFKVPNGYQKVSVLIIRWSESIDNFSAQHSEEV